MVAAVEEVLEAVCGVAVALEVVIGPVEAVAEAVLATAAGEVRGMHIFPHNFRLITNSSLKEVAEARVLREVAGAVEAALARRKGRLRRW